VTKRLLDKYKINTPTISYHQHSKVVKVQKVIELLEQGKDLALVTDAGTPGISDPGNKLIAEIYNTLSDEVEIVPIPGPSAVTVALSVSGLPTDKFLFLGFLPHKKGRQTAVRKIVASEYTVVLYESCHRIEKFLGELIDGGGADLKVVVCRELTKMFESIYRGAPRDILKVLQSDKKNLKGEFVVVVSK